jgi:hypothetical protein
VKLRRNAGYFRDAVNDERPGIGKIINDYYWKPLLLQFDNSMRSYIARAACDKNLKIDWFVICHTKTRKLTAGGKR